MSSLFNCSIVSSLSASPLLSSVALATVSSAYFTTWQRSVGECAESFASRPITVSDPTTFRMSLGSFRTFCTAAFSQTLIVYRSFHIYCDASKIQHPQSPSHVVTASTNTCIRPNSLHTSDQSEQRRRSDIPNVEIVWRCACRFAILPITLGQLTLTSLAVIPSSLWHDRLQTSFYRAEGLAKQFT